jgi:hypothetical protein
MKARDFCYWLQGYVEIRSNATLPDDREWQIILDHLQEAHKELVPRPFGLLGTSFEGMNDTNLCSSLIPTITC